MTARRAPIEIGLGVWGMQSPYMRPQPLTRAYEEAIRHARLAEDLGFDSFWMGEHRVSYCGTCPSLLAAGAFLAAATSRITFGAGILLLPLHGAERVAQVCAAFQAVAPGRLRLGLGLGYRPSEFAAAGRDRAARRKLFEEALRALVEDHADELGATELWFTGDADAPIRRAARHGGSLLVSQNTAIDHLPHVVDLFRSELRERSGQRPMISLNREVWAAPKPADGEDYKRRLTDMWLHYSNEWVAGPIREPEERRRFAQARTENTAIVGPPEAVVAGLAPAVAAGVDHLVLKVQFQGMDGDAIDDQLRLLADEVVPALRELA